MSIDIEAILTDMKSGAYTALTPADARAIVAEVESLRSERDNYRDLYQGLRDAMSVYQPLSETLRAELAQAKADCDEFNVLFLEEQSKVEVLEDELAQAHAETAVVVAAMQSLLNCIPDGELDIAREVWGNTNVGVVLVWKRVCENLLSSISPAAVALLADADLWRQVRCPKCEGHGEVMGVKYNYDTPEQVPEDCPVCFGSGVKEPKALLEERAWLLRRIDRCQACGSDEPFCPCFRALEEEQK